MAVTHINQILEWFKTGKKPTQAHFWATWGSFWHKHEGVVVKHPTQNDIDAGLKTLDVLTNGTPTTIPTSGGYGGSMQDLDSSKADLVGGKVPASQLPSYVDDVLEFADLASFPTTGETGIIYVALDTNFTYRWSGSAYVQIGGGVEGVLETQNKLITIPLQDLGVAIEDVTYEMVADYINNLDIVVEKGENYYFEVIEFSQETTDGLVIMDLTNSQPTPQSLFQITDLTN